jgi:hypothetical protein
MRTNKSDEPSIKKPIQIIFTIIAFIVFLAFGYLLSPPGIINIRNKSNPIFSWNMISSQRSSISKSQLNDSYSPVSNSTHLWSIPFADENYFRLARLLPCRTVEYKGGPKPDKIDSCDHSSTNEYSIQNTIQAQKWIYEHQHPSNCANKRFAIIQNFALSGFGSILHQIVWAFGMALAENRIAIYKTPGNWVR